MCKLLDRKWQNRRSLQNKSEGGVYQSKTNKINEAENDSITNCVSLCVLADIQEFYEVTLLDSQRWVESSKGADPMAPVNLWDFSSLQSTTVTSDTLPSLSTSIEVRTPAADSCRSACQDRKCHQHSGSFSCFLLLCSRDADRWLKIENGKNRSNLSDLAGWKMKLHLICKAARWTNWRHLFPARTKRGKAGFPPVPAPRQVQTGRTPGHSVFGLISLGWWATRFTAAIIFLLGASLSVGFLPSKENSQKLWWDCFIQNVKITGAEIHFCASDFQNPETHKCIFSSRYAERLWSVVS